MSEEKRDQSRRAAGSEQVERATDPGPEPDTRHDARGERHPDPYADAEGDAAHEDEPEDEVIERQRRAAEELQEHGDDEEDHPQR